MIKLLLPWALKLIGYFIEKEVKDGKIKKETRVSYLDFLKNMEPSLGDSARLRRESQSQIERLKEQMNEMDS